MKAIEADKLTKSYDDIVALRGVSFSVNKGEVIGLLGPNGAGKTTLMKLLTGYLQPDGGDAMVAGIDVVDDPLGVQRRIGYLPENAPVYTEMSVQEYLLMMASLRELPEEKIRSYVAEAVRATGLEDYLVRPIAVLSKGYRQRVGIAQAILHKPELLILDEPTTGLDPTQIAEIRDLIGHLSDHATVMLSTHILSEVEMTCERALIIMDGSVRADSKLSDLRAANAAVVAVERSASGVRELLQGIDGVDEVVELDADGDYSRWRLTSTGDGELCPMVFNALRDKSWRVGELRSDTRTLETVFRELVATHGQSASEPQTGQ